MPGIVVVAEEPSDPPPLPLPPAPGASTAPTDGPGSGDDGTDQVQESMDDLSKESVCTEYSCEFSHCATLENDPNTYRYWDCECSVYTFVQDDDNDPFDGGGGGGLPGDEEDSCDLSDPNGINDTLCGSGGTINPAPPVDEPVSKEEFKDLVQAACSDVPGLTLSDDPGAYQGFYQASARASLNSVFQFPIQKDKPEGEASRHPQLEFAGDGFVEAVIDNNTGNLVPGIVSGIMESKYSLNPGSTMGGSQYRRHFSELAKADQMAGVPIRNPQHYYLVSLSNNLSMQDLGSSYRYNDMLDEAAEHDINVYHYRLVREDDAHYLDLEGAKLSRSPGDQMDNWLADALDTNQISFVVSCTPEE